MNITRFKRKNSGKYIIYIDDKTEYELCEEIILKYELLLKKNITNEKLEQILTENLVWECYYSALKLINKFPKTKKELAHAMKIKGYTEEACEFAMNTLETQGYLNDSIYAKSYVHNKIMTTSHGPNRIRKDLDEKGVNEAEREEALTEYTDQIQKEKVEKIITKKIQSNRNKSNSALKRKIQSDLLMEGFQREIITEVIEKINFAEDRDIAKKEYEKIYKNLSRKYQGKDLEFRVKQKMRMLGFNDF